MKWVGRSGHGGEREALTICRMFRLRSAHDFGGTHDLKKEDERHEEMVLAVWWAEGEWEDLVVGAGGCLKTVGERDDYAVESIRNGEH